MKKNVKQIIYAMIISGFAQMQLIVNSKGITEQVIGSHINSKFLNDVCNLTLSMGHNNNLLFIIGTILCWLLMKQIKYNYVTKWHCMLVYIVSLVLSGYVSIGLVIREQGFFNSPITDLLILKILLKTIFLAIIICLMFIYLEQNLLLGNWLIKKDVESYFDFKKKFVLMFILWLPYYIILFPGTGNPDTLNQLTEFFGHGDLVRDVYPIGHYLLSNPAFSISNQHNFVMTIILGCFAKFGLVCFHNINIGLAIASLCQMLFVIFVFCYMLKILSYKCNNFKSLNVVFWIYALFPIFPIFSVYLVKNTFYSAAITWFVALLIEYSFNLHRQHLMSWRMLLLLDVVLQIISEKFAIYILALMFVFLLIMYRKDYVQWIGLIFLPLIIFQVGVSNILFVKLNVPQGDPIEAYSVAIQQTALCVKDDPKSITDKQRRIINKVFVYNNMARLYEPTISDPIKSSGGKYELNQMGYRYKTVTSKNMKEYKKVWFEMFWQHPKLYFEAFFNLNYQYLDINSNQPNTQARVVQNSLPLALWNADIPSGHPGHNKIYQNRSFMNVRKLLQLVFNILVKIPPFSLMLSGNAYIWLSIFAAVCSIRAFKARYLVAFLPILLQIPILMLSPQNNSQRYMMPIIFSAIFLFSLLITLLSTRDKSERP